MAGYPQEAPKSPLPTSMIVVSESEAKKLNVGEITTITSTGKVLGIRECYGDNNKGQYEVTLENPTTSAPIKKEKKVMSVDDMNDSKKVKEMDDMSADEMREVLPKKDY